MAPHPPLTLLYTAVLGLLFTVTCHGAEDPNARFWHFPPPAHNGNPGTRLRGFKTEPFILPQVLKPIERKSHKFPLFDGYIFLAMMKKEENTWGPQILDHDGNLIWYGNDLVKNRVSDFHVCDYMGEQGNHLCWHERKPNHKLGRPDLQKVILTDQYELLHNFTTRGDGHEFHMVDNGRRFVTLEYKTKSWDLTPYYGDKDGYILDPCLSEYDSETGELTWEWCYTDHLPLSDSKVYFAAQQQMNVTTHKAGHGVEDSPWDVGHLNAVDKDENGDYIGSFRHLDQIMKIAGPDSKDHEPNTIIWRLNGNGNSFKGLKFDFSKQHHVRFIPDHPMRNNYTEVIHLFNNAWEGVRKPIAKASSGQIIALNTQNWKATLLREYVHPHHRLSGSRGSMQVLPNGNAFLGWGNLPEISEFAEDETVLYHAYFADFHGGDQYSYRAFKQKWVGRPISKPKLVVYTHSCSHTSPMYAYVSWNGATEVKKWQFSKGISEAGPWIHMGDFDKDGFETRARLPGEAVPYVKVAGIDANGNTLGEAQTLTFIPRLEVKGRCNEKSCPDHFHYDPSESRIGNCAVIYAPAILPLVLLLIALEFCVSFGNKYIRSYVDAGLDHRSPSISDLLPVKMSFLP